MAMKVGFVGLGTMGGSMALNIRKAGYDMVVHDVRPEAAARHLDAGCEWACSPKALAEKVDLVFTSLPGPPQVEAVVLGEDGLMAGMKPGAAIFDLSTNSPRVVRSLCATLAEKGIAFLDAPVSGGAEGAASGKLAVWVGGDEALFNRYRSVLDAFSDEARYIGPIGAGTVAKLVHNISSFVIQTAIAEAFTMGVKAGVPPLDLWAAVRQGVTGRARTYDRFMPGFLDGIFDPPNFALALAHKDATLAIELGREIGVPMRLSNLVREEMTEAMNRGWGGRDSRVPMWLQEERAGVEIGESQEAIDAIYNRDGR
jgi:3-hydroxyisobutyrate dehydrogenase